MESSMKGVTKAELINSALMNEKLAADHYDNVSEACSKAGAFTVAKFFRDQANRERGHFISLFKYRSKCDIKSYLALGENINWLGPESGADQNFKITANMNISDALSLVEESEKRAERFYREAVEEVDDPELKELFNKLAEDEAHHTYLTCKIRSIYETKGIIDGPDYDDLGFS